MVLRHCQTNLIVPDLYYLHENKKSLKERKVWGFVHTPVTWLVVWHTFIHPHKPVDQLRIPKHKRLLAKLRSLVSSSLTVIHPQGCAVSCVWYAGHTPLRSGKLALTSGRYFSPICSLVAQQHLAFTFA